MLEGLLDQLDQLLLSAVAFAYESLVIAVERLGVLRHLLAHPLHPFLVLAGVNDKRHPLELVI